MILRKITSQIRKLSIKSSLPLWGGLGWGLALFMACSPIDKQDYLIEMPAPEIGRNVLIEDFTGQRCVNCPAAADLIEQLTEEYGADRIIAVGIHSGALGFAGNSKNVGLMNDEGKAYGEQWEIPYQPIGLVNRVGGLKDRDMWASAVREEIQKMSPVILSVEGTMADGTRTAKIDVEATALKDIDATLQVWLTEDNITAMQMMPDGSTNRDYVHNHVFRATINGLGGEKLAIANGKGGTKSYTFEIPEDCVPANCSVVAFLFNDKEGVLDVQKVGLEVLK